MSASSCSRQHIFALFCLLLIGSAWLFACSPSNTTAATSSVTPDLPSAATAPRATPSASAGPAPTPSPTSSCLSHPGQLVNGVIDTALLPKPMERSRFMDFLKNRGIQSSIHYPPIHQFSYYRQLWPPDFDHQLAQTEEIAAREVTLPLFPSMTMQQLEEVIRAIRDFCRLP